MIRMKNKLKFMNDLEDIRLTKEFIFLNPYRFIVGFVYAIIFLLIGVGVWLSLTHKQETVDVHGTLVNVNKISDIQLLADGVVEEVFAAEGAYVEKGERILSLRSDKLESQKEELSAKIEDAQKHLGYLSQLQECLNQEENTFEDNDEQGYYYAQAENFLSQVNALQAGVFSGESNALSTQRSALRELMSAMKDETTLDTDHAYHGQIELFRMKLEEYQMKLDQLDALIQAEADPILAAQYQQQKDAVESEKSSYSEQNQLQVQQQIDSLTLKINQSWNMVNDTRKKADAEVENLRANAIVGIRNKEQELTTAIQGYESTMASIDIDLDSYQLSASEAGYISYITKIKEGDLLSAGVILGSLNAEKDAEKEYEVTLNVPSSGIGFIKPGQGIKLTVDGLKRKDYGFIDGTVKQIYDTPVQSKEGTFYQVTAAVDLQTNNGIYADSFALKDNMSVQANIITKETSWLTYLLQKMNILRDADENT